MSETIFDFQSIIPLLIVPTTLCLQRFVDELRRSRYYVFCSLVIVPLARVEAVLIKVLPYMDSCSVLFLDRKDIQISFIWSFPPK